MFLVHRTSRVRRVAALAGAWLAAVSAPAARADEPTRSAAPAPLAIFLRAHASAAEQLGARELAAELGARTGAKIATVVEPAPLPESAIVVGPCAALAKLGVKLDAAHLGDEGFVLKSVGRRLVVAGTGPRGTLYGCVTLLEKLGVRWFTPEVTRRPRPGALTLPTLDEVDLPAFEYREPYFAEAFDRDWAWHNKVNGNGAHLDAGCGGKVVYRPFVHSFDELVPRSHFAAHPEWFPEIGGQRVDGYVQRCLTQEGVLATTLANVRRIVAETPDVRIVSVSQNDTANFCECAACRAKTQEFGAHSGLYLWFVNQVAAALAKEAPQLLIDTLAYQFTEAPPTGIRPAANVRVRLCPIACCVAHPFEECAAPADAAFLDHLRGWGRLTDALYIWHYNANFNHFLLPLPDFAEFPADLRLYRRVGVRGLFLEGAYAAGGGSDGELRAWVMARLLWNPDADASALVDEWMQGVYGAAAPPMRQWFDRLHAEVRAPDRHVSIFGPPTAAYLSPAVLEAGERWFDEAAHLAADDPVATRAVAKARLALRYTRLAQQPRVDAEFEAFLRDLKEFGVTSLAEGRSVADFEADVRARAPKK